LNCPRCQATNRADARRCSACDAAFDDATRVAGAGDPAKTEAPSPDLRTGTGWTVTSGAASVPAPTALQPGDRLGDRYEIRSVLGAGGFGAVYKADDTVLGRTVALKVIHPALAARPDMIERFKREILLASRITHKNVVRIHDLGEVGELKFISMNFIEGTDLKTIITRDGPLGLERALPIMRQVAEALQAAHEAGVVHRDLKPQNVLIDVEGNAYVADFGISRSVEGGHTMTETGSVLGTLAYMSPEQARGETADHRSDIYSFGLILYEIFTGDVPFARAVTPLSQLMKRVQEDVPSIATTRSELPPWVVRIVSRALARDLADRYQSFDEILRDLQRQRAAVAVRRRVRTRLLQVAALVLVAAALAAAGRAWLFPARQAEAVPAVQTGLVLLPFHNGSEHADDAWTATGLPRLLRFDLEQSNTLLVVGEERVQQIVDGLKLGRGAGPLDNLAIQRLAQVLRVENALVADLYRTGQDSYRLQARLLRVGASTISAEEAIEVEGSGPQGLFTLVGELAGEIRRRLGVARGRGAHDLTRLSTPSVEALRRYNEGLDLVRSAQDVGAAQRFEEALAIDPAFAIARADLAETYDRLGRESDAQAQAESALGNIERLSDYEIARIRAVRARLAGDPAAGLAAYRELTTVAPNRPSAQLARALFEEDAGDLAGALVTIDRTLALDPRNPTARFTRGRLLAKLSRPDEALSEFGEALALHEEIGNAEGRATVLNGLGNIHVTRGEYDRALTSYRECLKVREEIGDRRGRGATLNNIAMTQRAMGHHDEAIEFQQQALQVLGELGDNVELARAYGGLGDIHNSAGDLQAAKEAYETSLRLLRDSGDEASLAQAFGNLGFIKRMLGHYDEAFFHQKEALAKRRLVGDVVDIMFSLSDIGAAEHVQGHFEPALRYYAEGMELARKNDNRAGVVVFSMNLAEIHLEQADFAAALAALAEAEAGARELEASDFLTTCLADLADARRELGDLAGAGRALDEAAALGVSALEARILIGRGQLLLLEGNASRARELLARAVTQAERTGEHRLLLQVRFAAAEAAGDAAAIETVLREAERSGLEPIVARARLALALALAGRAGAGAAALQACERTIELADRLRMRDVSFRANQLAAALLARERHSEQAVLSSLAALGRLEEMRRGLAGEPLAQLLGRPATRAFAAQAGALFRQVGRTTEVRRLEEALAPTAAGDSRERP